MGRVSEISNEEIKRAAYSTSLDPEIVRKMKIHCAINDINHNVFLEEAIMLSLRKKGEGECDYSKRGQIIREG